MNAYLHRHRYNKNKSLRYLLTAFLILAGPVAAADSYLDALRDEAGGLEYLDETRPSNAVTDRKKTVSPEIRQAIQNINQFEEYYRKQDSAGAGIYFRLDTQERLRIFHRFKSTRDFEVARKMTIELFNKKK